MASVPAAPATSSRIILVFGASIGLGAFLLFQVQPLLGKYVLPWFGGGPGVWTACLLFFQVGLLGGYIYAHLLTSRFAVKTQCWVHCGLLLASLIFLPITPASSWKPTGTEQPVLAILGLLGATVGLPYVLLAASGPLLQSWVAGAFPNARVYRLYSLSNAASVAALLSYPLLFEPKLTRQAQANSWSLAFAAYVFICSAAALIAWRKMPSHTAAPEPVNNGSHLRSSFPTKVMWLLLPACSTMLLMALTNKLCQDVAVVPFLWVAPLTLYLASFILAFDSPRWYARLPFTLALCISLAGLCWVMRQGTNLSLATHIVAYCAALFVCCTVCHGELYRLRPATAALTSYYLVISAGGALGGAFVAVAAPMLFNTYVELPLGMVLCALLYTVICAVPRIGGPSAESESRTWLWLGWLLPILAFAGIDLWLHILMKTAQAGARGAILGLRIGVWCTVALLLLSWFLRRDYRQSRHWRGFVCLWLIFGCVALMFALWKQISHKDPDMVYRSRNFYGVLTVYEHRRAEPLAHHALLQHGGITHGLQFLDRDQQSWPTSYYSEESGIGKAFRALPAGPRRIGLVGLGTGTLATYGQRGDTLRVYEINPAVEHIARSFFTYLKQSPADVEVVLGDARISMERELPQQFDLLVLDAFSSDAIPTHLLTREAFSLYDRHLREGGIIAVHISNHYLDLEPVVRALAREFRFFDVLVDTDEEEEQWWNYTSSWMLLTRSRDVMASSAIRAVLREAAPKQPGSKELLWTDDFTSLYQILR